MKKRTYSQYCALARALDVVGERWTLLIIRELLTGPKRYKDLLHRLDGIGTNLLASRLKMLEAGGLAERRALPPPASTTAYALTARGLALEPAVVELARWGLRLLALPGDDDAYAPGWAIVAMKAVFRPEAARGVDDEYEYRIDGEVFHARITDGTLTTGQGAARNPGFVLTTDTHTLRHVVRGTLPVEEALEQGRFRLTGDAEAFARSTRIFDLSPIHDAVET